MGIISNIFGSDKAIDRTFDVAKGIGGWIDEQQFTPEEKAEERAGIRKWKLEFLSAMAPFKVVQRIIAFAIMGGWLFLLLTFVGMILFDHVNIDAMKELMLSNYIVYPTTALVSLYLGGGTIESFKRKT